MKNDYARQYGDLQQWHWWFRGRQRIIEAVLHRQLGNHALSRRILSVGCGPAEGLNWLLPFAGPEGSVVGLDAEPLHTSSVPQDLNFVIARLENAPLADASFDLVLALDVLEHLDDDASGLCEALRLVKPGGLLLITVPALPSLWGGQDVVNEHRRRYTKRSLIRLFEKVKLENYWVNYFNFLLFPLIASIRWSRRVVGIADNDRSDFENSRPGQVNETLAQVFKAERHIINNLRLPVGVSLIATGRQMNPRDS